MIFLARVALAQYDRHMPSKETNPIPKPSIGLLRETSLHAALKTWYAQEGDRLEVLVDGYVIDIFREGLLVEIQTSNFSNLKVKLVQLTRNYPVRLVYPIAQQKWIVRVSLDGHTMLTRRRSPKHGRVEHLFNELVRFPALISDSNFSIEVLLTQEEEIWRGDGKGSWRRKGWSIADRQLLGVRDRLIFSTIQEFRALLPPDLRTPFTTRDLAQTLAIQQPLAQRMVYCLREMGVLEAVGKQRQAWLYIPRDNQS